MRLVARAAISLLALSTLAACGGDKAIGPTPPPPPPPATTGTLTIQNSSNRTIDELYYAECAAPDWGVDRLVGEAITPNGTKAYTVNPGCYDVLVVATTGAYAEFAARQVAAGQTVTVTVTN